MLALFTKILFIVFIENIILQYSITSICLLFFNYSSTTLERALILMKYMVNDDAFIKFSIIR